VVVVRALHRRLLLPQAREISLLEAVGVDATFLLHLLRVALREDLLLRQTLAVGEVALPLFGDELLLPVTRYAVLLSRRNIAAVPSCLLAFIPARRTVLLLRLHRRWRDAALALMLVLRLLLLRVL